MPTKRAFKINSLIYLPWLLVAAMYLPVFRQLYAFRWQMIDYTHAYFILPVFLWLVWLKRRELELVFCKTPPCSGYGGLAALVLGAALFVFGWRNDYMLVSALSFIVVVAGLAAYLYGSAILKAIRFPVLYLLLLVPPPLGILDAVTLPMRYATSVMAVGVVRSFFLPVTRSGLLLYAGGTEIFMGQPCSGFRSLIAMLSLGLVYAYLHKGPFKNKVVLVASIIPLAFLCNVLRVSAMCAATCWFGREIGERVHDIGGYVVFGLLILGMLAVERLMERRNEIQP